MKTFWIGHQMLGDVLGFCAAAHLYAHKIGQPVQIWFEPARKDACKYFEGVEWIEKTPDMIDCGGNPTLDEWPQMNGVKRFYRFMDPTMSPGKSFDIHFNIKRFGNRNGKIGLITHSNTQGDIDQITLKEMISKAKSIFPESTIALIGNMDNTLIPEGVEDQRQPAGSIDQIIATIRDIELLITPQSGPCFIAAGLRVPMWVYRSKEAFWDYTLNYETYQVERWFERSDKQSEDFQVFDSLYRSGGWSGLGSGPGSTLEFNKEYIWLLHKILDYTPNINSIVDIGCGDWQIMRHINFSKKCYLGVDVAASVIDKNTVSFGKGGISFKVLNPVTEDIPDADIFIVKDVLQHLPIACVKSILSKLVGKSGWILITNDHTGENVSHDIKVGQWRPLNVLLPPYNFPGITIAGYNGKHVTLSRVP